MESGKLSSAAWNSRPVHQLVDQQEITLEQSVLHAAAGDLERLDTKGADDDEQGERDDDDLRPVRQKGKPATGTSSVG